jgi:hypothetical protein
MHAWCWRSSGRAGAPCAAMYAGDAQGIVSKAARRRAISELPYRAIAPVYTEQEENFSLSYMHGFVLQPELCHGDLPWSCLLT